MISNFFRSLLLLLLQNEQLITKVINLYLFYQSRCDVTAQGAVPSPQLPLSHHKYPFVPL
jgi:hypothetical protein